MQLSKKCIFSEHILIQLEIGDSRIGYIKDSLSLKFKITLKNTKLLKLLLVLNSAETRRFADFVESPFYNKHSNVIKLCRFILKFSTSYADARLTKENAGRAVFKNETYTAQQLSDVMSYLTKLLEEFIATIQYQKQTLLKKQYLLEELRERNSNAIFQWTAAEFSQQLQKTILRDQRFHYHNYLFESESDAYFIKNENRKFHESIQRKSDNLDYFYLSAKLKIACEMMNRQNIISATYQTGLLDELVQYVKSNLNQFKNIPSISIYYHILLSLTESEKLEHYRKLLVLLHKNYLLFSAEEARQMYDFAQNYCIKKINRGDIAFGKELLSLYKTLLETKIIFEGNYLSQWDYKNIVTIALREQELNWCKNFITNYQNQLAPDVRENAYAYNMASYYYSIENYKEALKLLQKVEFTDVFYHLGSKSLLLKAYYEMDNADSFYSLISAFRVYLRRNKHISEAQFNNHLNLINLAKKCFDLKYNDYSKFIFKSKLEKIKSKISNNKNIANLVWLNEKLSEFEV